MLCDRYHILPSQLDEEDSARLIPMINAVNTYQVVRRMVHWVDHSGGKYMPSADDMLAYTEASQAAQENPNP